VRADGRERSLEVGGESMRGPLPQDVQNARTPEREGAWAAAVSSRRENSSCIVALSAPKDGVGRSTLAAHLAVAALRNGTPTGLVDLDTRDRGLTRWLRRRQQIAERRPDLVMPAALDADPLDAEGERARWPAVAEAMRKSCALIVVDLPAGCDALAREAVARADRVITMVADAAVEVDRLLDVDLKGRDAGRPSSYAKMIWHERLERARADGRTLDWRILRARRLAGDSDADARFDEAERRLGANHATPLPDDLRWRASFSHGLTALDLAGAAAVSAASPADEALRDLLIALRLPSLEGARLSL
jgi:chromosome partitioning protein